MGGHCRWRPTHGDKKPKEKKPPSGYMLFCKQERPGIVKKNPKMAFGEVGKALERLHLDHERPLHETCHLCAARCDARVARSDECVGVLKLFRSHLVTSQGLRELLGDRQVEADAVERDVHVTAFGDELFADVQQLDHGVTS